METDKTPSTPAMRQIPLTPFNLIRESTRCMRIAGIVIMPLILIIDVIASLLGRLSLRSAIALIAECVLLLILFFFFLIPLCYWRQFVMLHIMQQEEDYFHIKLQDVFAHQPILTGCGSAMYHDDEWFISVTDLQIIVLSKNYITEISGIKETKSRGERFGIMEVTTVEGNVITLGGNRSRLKDLKEFRKWYRALNKAEHTAESAAVNTSENSTKPLEAEVEDKESGK